jgi:transcription termination factor NusA, C-terminal duplication
VVAELQGEKIDIIPWNNDEPTFIVNALAPAEVSKVVLDEEADRVEVVVPDEQLSLAIGRRGQNVRLASQLTGWQIDIITEAQDSERRQKEFAERTLLFQEALDVDEVIAQLLVTEGFATVEDLAWVEAYEISDIEGFDEDTADELQTRAREFLDRQAAELDAKRKALGVEDAVMDVPGVTLAIAVALGEGSIKTVEDLADLATDEIRGGFEIVNGEKVKINGVLESFNLSQEDAEMLILQARVAAGWIDASELPQPEPEAEYFEEGELAEGEYDADAVFADLSAQSQGDAVETLDDEQPEDA